MGSIVEKTDLDSDEETPLSATAARRKVHNLDFEMGSRNSRSDFGKSNVFDLMWKSKLRSIYIILIRAKINVLLPFGPLAIFLHYVTGKHGLVFFFSLVGIIPLAERLGFATEQLAFYTGPTGKVTLSGTSMSKKKARF